MKKIVSILILSILTFLPANAKDIVKYTDMQDGTYVFMINTKKYGEKIKPYLANQVMTPEKLYNDKGYELVVNGGFFDVKNGKSVSYVTINNELVSDVKNNKELIKDLEKQNRLDRVLSRGELRIYETKRHKLKFDIAYHNKPIKKGYTLKHALQAGPILKPSMDLSKEGFVEYDGNVLKSQSVDILKRRERTAVGLRGKNLYIVIFTKDNKVDAYRMQEYLTKKLKIKKAIAFDGGLSTAITYNNFSIGSLGKYQRKVKSFLVIER